jgi:hypothetical protein
MGPVVEGTGPAPIDERERVRAWDGGAGGRRLRGRLRGRPLGGGGAGSNHVRNLFSYKSKVIYMK